MADQFALVNEIIDRFDAQVKREIEIGDTTEQVAPTNDHSDEWPAWKAGMIYAQGILYRTCSQVAWQRIAKETPCSTP